MCNLCNPLPLTVTRRQFLSSTAAFGLAALFTGCKPVEISPQGTLTGRTSEFFPREEWPSLVGQFVDITREQITLASLTQTHHYSLSTQIKFYDAQQQSQKKATYSSNDPLLVWLDPPTHLVIKVAQLPPISDFSGEIPYLEQPAPTLDTRPFGAQTLITRAGWGAAEHDYAIGGESGLFDPETNRAGWLIYDEPLEARLHSVVIHHAALDFSTGPREIQALHMRTSKFADIGYHFLIDGLGQLYEGRPLNVRGAHTGGHNTGFVGICLLGNFEIAPPIRSQWETLTQLLVYLKSRYLITNLGGHRDYQPGVTACPGERLHPLLPQLARSLGLQYDNT